MDAGSTPQRPVGTSEDKPTVKGYAGRAGRRVAGWAGGLLIAAVLALAAYDAQRSYQQTVLDVGIRLDSQARVIAEQTTRSVQAIDVVLRHIADQYKAGALSRATPQELHQYLGEQSVGLVQSAGLVVFDTEGNTVATSFAPPEKTAGINASYHPVFQMLRARGDLGLVLEYATFSRLDGTWIMPMARRLERADGSFAGTIGGRGKIDYFQDFYRDIALEPGTSVTLMHRKGTLMARYPAVEGSLGKHYPTFEALQKAYAELHPAPTRRVSAVDGVERFAALQDVPDYPLVVVVARDTDAALGEWRTRAWKIGLRTLALAGLAAVLLGFLLRQLDRLHAARVSLEESRERYALAVSGSDDGIWDFDYVNNQAFASRRTREIHGLPPEPETQPLDRWLAELKFHPDDLPRRLAAMQAHLAGETPAYVGEFRILHPSGNYRWVRIHGLCLRDAQGRPQRMAGSVSDIDARKRAEESLRESEQRFALAVAGSNDGIIDWDMVGDRMYTSERTLEILGIESSETLHTRAQWMAMLKLHPEDKPRHDAELQAYLDGKTALRDGEYRVQHPDGQYRWVRVRNMCVRDAEGRPTRMAGSVSDIDAGKRVESALRESEERYQLAVAGSNEGLWDWDLASDTLFVSPRAQSFMGLEPSEPRRPRREWLARSQTHPDDAPAVRTALSAHLRGASQHLAVEFRMRHPDGQWRWFRQRGLALRDGAGKPYRMAGSMEDISETKRAEAERDRLETKLRQAQKLEAMGTLAGGIAHDFNNILSAILGYGEMAQKDAPPESRLHRHLGAVLNAGQRAKALVERILAFSRSGMGERVPIHVQSVVGEALDLVLAAMPAGVTLNRRLEAGDAAVIGDPTQIHQVVMNLCTNAVQALGGGGELNVSLARVEMETTTLATSTLAAGSYLRLSVADTGAGISPKIVERIFDPFFTTKEVGVGSGLGLSLVHGIVTDLGGGIEVDSRPGEGSRFSVYLPWRGETKPQAIVAGRVARGAGQTILVVDDEPALVELVEEMLAECGYEPVGFASSAAALAAVREQPGRFDAVLSDQTMPGLTGEELARELQALRPELPVVLMSGFVSAGLVERARAAGVAEVLAKPLAQEEIARCLDVLLNA